MRGTHSFICMVNTAKSWWNVPKIGKNACFKLGWWAKTLLKSNAPGQRGRSISDLIQPRMARNVWSAALEFHTGGDRRLQAAWRSSGLSQWTNGLVKSSCGPERFRDDVYRTQTHRCFLPWSNTDVWRLKGLIPSFLLPSMPKKPFMHYWQLYLFSLGGKISPHMWTVFDLGRRPLIEMVTCCGNVETFPSCSVWVCAT